MPDKEKPDEYPDFIIKEEASKYNDDNSNGYINEKVEELFKIVKNQNEY